jgi:Protein of unknown function (DUF3040)
LALPMDEQRILEEMERMLAADDPKLAARLAAFGQPGFGQVLRTRRARATLSIMLLILIAAVAAVIYMMSVFRPTAATGPNHRATHSAAPSTRVSTGSASAGSDGAAPAKPAASGPGAMSQSCPRVYAPACKTHWSP